MFHLLPSRPNRTYASLSVLPAVNVLWYDESQVNGKPVSNVAMIDALVLTIEAELAAM